MKKKIFAVRRPNFRLKNNKGLPSFKSEREKKSLKKDAIMQWELSKKLKFNHTNKWYMQNRESFQENETHKLLWDFEIQTDHLISARRTYLVIIKKIKKKTNRIVNISALADQRVKIKESGKRDKYLDLVRNLQKKKRNNGT